MPLWSCRSLEGTRAVVPRFSHVPAGRKSWQSPSKPVKFILKASLFLPTVSANLILYKGGEERSWPYELCVSCIARPLWLHHHCFKIKDGVLLPISFTRWLSRCGFPELCCNFRWQNRGLEEEGFSDSRLGAFLWSTKVHQMHSRGWWFFL